MESREIKFVQQCLQAASEIARQYFGSVVAETKTHDPVQVLTAADSAISEFFVARIKAEFPDHNIIDEETGVVDRGSEYTWVVDPLDGTSNFASGLPFYGILLGMLRVGQPIVGGMALPAFDEMYWAEEGKGAYCNGKRLSISNPSDLTSKLLAFNFDPDRQNSLVTGRKTEFLAALSSRFNNTRSSNSCFDHAMVAQGKYAAAVFTDSKIWDNVAPHVILEEAGARYTEIRGDVLLYDIDKIDNNYAICTGGARAHEIVWNVARYYF